MDQEQASLLHVKDGFQKVIVAGDRYISGYNENGILVESLYDFLLGKQNLWKQDNNDFIKFKRIVGFTLKKRQVLSGTARCKMTRAIPLLQLGASYLGA